MKNQKLKNEMWFKFSKNDGTIDSIQFDYAIDELIERTKKACIEIIIEELALFVIPADFSDRFITTISRLIKDKKVKW